MNGKKVLITGGFGNLGSWISLYLAKQGYEIYILTRKEKEKLVGSRYKVIECDITNLEELEKKLDFEIDYCIHCASFNESFLPDYPKKALEINTLGTRNLLEVLSGKNLKNFIYFSTFHVYGLNSGVIDEETTLNPKNDYASTHLFAEYYVKQFGFTHNLKYTIFRLSNSYGVPTFANTDKWYLVLNDLVKSAFMDKSIVLKTNGEAKRDFIWMDDVAMIVDEVMKIDPTNDIYNLSSGKSHTVLDLAKIVQQQYQNLYNQNIEIEINDNDRMIYDDVSIKNDKLKSIITFDLQDKIAGEVKKIFKLLEDKSE